MNPTFRKNLITNLLIIVGFALISMMYCFPAMQGKILAAHDNIMWRGVSEEARKVHESTGETVLWSNSMFGGMPSYTFYTGDTNNQVPKILNAIESVMPRPVHFLFIAMLSFFALTLVLRINKWAGVVGALAYAFAAFFVESVAAGHDTKVLAMAYMPAVLAGFFLTFRGRYIAGAALTCISLSLMTFANHVQIMYYLAIVLAFAWVALLIFAIKGSQVKQFVIATAISLGAAALAIVTCMGNVLITQEYTKYTMRGGESELSKNRDNNTKKAGGLDKEYAFRWSLGKGETFCIMVPDLFGGSNSPGESIDRFPDNEEVYNQYMNRGGEDVKVPTYWGPQPILAGPVYFGAVICFLFVLGMMVIRSPHKWWIAAVCLLAIIMSWGKNFPGFNYWLFDNLPLYNKFRTPSMVLSVPELLFPLLGVWAITDIIAGRVDESKLIKNLFIAAGITAGIALIVGVGAGMFGDFISLSPGTNEKEYPADLLEALKSDRQAMALKSGMLSAFFILLSAAVVWLFAKRRIAALWLVAGVGLVALIDLVPVATRYLNSSVYQDEEEFKANNFSPRRVDQQILQDSDPYYRVLDVSRDPFNDGYAAYFHKMIGGYSPAKMEIYQDLISEQMGQGFNASVLNMLNTKYIIYGQPGQEAVMQNPDACGNAWFVDDIKWVQNADSEMYSMNAAKLGDTARVSGGFEPKKTAIIRNSWQKDLGSFAPGNDSAASVVLTKYGLNDISYQSNNSREGLAVFSDIWYPAGWKAYIDGKEAPIVRANYVLRALKVPAGQHKIEFKFRPATFYKGERIALFASLAVFALLLWAIIDTIRKQKKAAEDQHAGVNQG